MNLTMPPDPPKLVYSLLPRPVFGICLLACYSVLVAGDPRPIVKGLGLAGIILAIFTTLREIRVASTRVTETGISQLTWGGRFHLSWSEVTGMTRKPFTLSAQTRRLIVPVEAFENTAAAIAYIEARLPPAVVRH